MAATRTKSDHETATNALRGVLVTAGVSPTQELLDRLVVALANDAGWVPGSVSESKLAAHARSHLAILSKSLDGPDPEQVAALTAFAYYLTLMLGHTIRHDMEETNET